MLDSLSLNITIECIKAKQCYFISQLLLLGLWFFLDSLGAYHDDKECEGILHKIICKKCKQGKGKTKMCVLWGVRSIQYDLSFNDTA